MLVPRKRFPVCCKQLTSSDLCGVNCHPSCARHTPLVDLPITTAIDQLLILSKKHATRNKNNCIVVQHYSQPHNHTQPIHSSHSKVNPHLSHAVCRTAASRAAVSHAPGTTNSTRGAWFLHWQPSSCTKDRGSKIPVKQAVFLTLHTGRHPRNQL